MEDKENKNLGDKSSDSNVNKSVSGEGDSKNIQHTEEQPKASSATDKDKTSAGESKTVIKKAKKVKKGKKKHRVEGFLINGLSAQNLSSPEKFIDSPSIPHISAAVKYFFS